MGTNLPFRGAMAGWLGTAEAFAVYTRKTAVAVFAGGRAEAKAIAKTLIDAARTASRTGCPRSPIAR